MERRKGQSIVVQKQAIKKISKITHINPVFTIVGIVAGELLWGIPGMILALPVLGILKIICDHIEPLKPYGFLIGEEKKQKQTRPAGMKKIIKKVAD